MKRIVLNKTMTYGIITGLIIIAISFLLWATNAMIKQIMLSIPVVLLQIIILISGMVIGTKTIRSRLFDGYITFNESFKVGFFIAFFTIILIVSYNLILDYVIDVEYFHRKLDAMKEFVYNTYSSNNVPEDIIEEKMRLLDIKSKPSAVYNFFSSIIIYSIGATILSLIIASILKREKPLFDIDNSKE